MRRLAVLAAMVAPALLPAAAHAHSGIAISGSALIYHDTAAGSVSSLRFSAPSPGTIRVSDPMAAGGVSPGPCVPITEHEAECSADGIALIVASVGDMNDEISLDLPLEGNLSGGSGNDRISGNSGDDYINGSTGDDLLFGHGGADLIYGGYGVDNIEAGAGDDDVRVSDGFVDTVSCGPGADKVTVDELDVVSLTGPDACEQVVKQAPATSDPGTEEPPDTTDPGSGPVIGGGEGAPVIAALRLRPARFRARSTRVHYRLSEPASVSFSVERPLPGRRAGRRCRAPHQAPRGRRCTRWRRAMGFTDTGREGANSLRLRVGRLRAGAYRLTAVAVDAVGKPSSPRRARFRLLPRR